MHLQFKSNLKLNKLKSFQRTNLKSVICGYIGSQKNAGTIKYTTVQEEVHKKNMQITFYKIAYGICLWKGRGGGRGGVENKVRIS